MDIGSFSHPTAMLDLHADLRSSVLVVDLYSCRCFFFLICCLDDNSYYVPITPVSYSLKKSVSV